MALILIRCSALLILMASPAMAGAAEPPAPASVAASEASADASRAAEPRRSAQLGCHPDPTKAVACVAFNLAKQARGAQAAQTAERPVER